MTTRSRIRVDVYTQSVTYVAEGILDVFEAIVHKLGLSPSYLAGNSQVLLDGLTVWLYEGKLEKVYLVIEDRFGRTWSLGELRIQYIASGDAGAFYDDLEAARYEASKLGLPPMGTSYRVVVHRSPGATPVPGWMNATLPSSAGLVRSRVGGAVGSPSIEASLTMWRRS